MNNTFGNHITLTLFGESHGKAVGCVLDGIGPGVKIDYDLMERMMNRRKARGSVSTARHEKDIPEIISGVRNGVTEGTPITFLIANEDVRSADYGSTLKKPRPGHADYAAHMRCGGFEDERGGGHFSGRLTAPLTAAGAVCMSLLNQRGIYIGSHIIKLAGERDRDFDEEHLKEDIDLLNHKLFPVLEDETEERMKAAIEAAAMDFDSLGGILDTAVTGLEAGIGDPWFDTLEGMLAHALFSIPAVKGVEFGSGFAFADLKGSEANDPFACEAGKVVTLSNHNGGINGGISNGMPVRFRTVIKPTPSIARAQRTVDLVNKENTVIEIRGRHDPAIIHRAAPVIDAMSAFVLCDALCSRYGYAWMREGNV